MGKYFLLSLVLVSLLSYSAGNVCAQGNILTGKNADSKEVCSLIKDNLERGVGAKAVTKTNIQLGHNTCYVIKCAIAAGGNLDEIISGAVEAGATPDVISRCAIDAGVDAGAVAEGLTRTGSTSPYYSKSEGPGYLAAEGELVPIDPLPNAASGGGYVSPSGF
jgi:hypothetical protein